MIRQPYISHIRAEEDFIGKASEKKFKIYSSELSLFFIIITNTPKLLKK